MHGYSNETIEDKISIELYSHDRVDFLLENILEAEQTIIKQYNIGILNIKLGNLTLPKMFANFFVNYFAISSDFN